MNRTTLKIPLFSPKTTKISLFNNSFQVWVNPSYAFSLNRHWYKDFDRFMFRVGKLVFCYTKVWY